MDDDPVFSDILWQALSTDSASQEPSPPPQSGAETDDSGPPPRLQTLAPVPLEQETVNLLLKYWRGLPLPKYALCLCDLVCLWLFWLFYIHLLFSLTCAEVARQPLSSKMPRNHAFTPCRYERIQQQPQPQLPQPQPQPQPKPKPKPKPNLYLNLNLIYRHLGEGPRTTVP